MDKDLAAVLVSPDNLFVAFTAIVTFATIMTLAMPYMNRGGLEARLKSVANRREELRRKSREALAKDRTSASLRQTDQTVYKGVVDRLNLSSLLEDSNVQEKLAQAGLRGPAAISRFYFFRFVMPFALGAFSAFYIFIVNPFHFAML